MEERIREQLESLRQEREAGVKMLTDLETRRAELQHTLLRIEGAVQVLRELLGEDEPDSEDGASDEDPAA